MWPPTGRTSGEKNLILCTVRIASLSAPALYKALIDTGLTD